MIKKTNYYLFAAIFFIILGVLTLVSIALHFVYAGHKYSEYGTLGDAIGGITNPIIAVGAAILTFAAFYVQYQANKQVQDQFKIQQFESQFYEMLRLHKENINEMKISGYDFNVSESYNSKTEEMIITRNQVERFVEGRKTFVAMDKELIACYEICEKYNSFHKYKKTDLLELSYSIFFFGSASDVVGHKNINMEFIKMLKDEMKRIRDKHKETVAEVNELVGLYDKIIKLHFKYAPFTGHESRLGHYYRHLFSTVKFVVRKEEEGLFDYK